MEHRRLGLGAQHRLARGRPTPVLLDVVAEETVNQPLPGAEPGSSIARHEDERLAGLERGGLPEPGRAAEDRGHVQRARTPDDRREMHVDRPHRGGDGEHRREHEIGRETTTERGGAHRAQRRRPLLVPAPIEGDEPFGLLARIGGRGLGRFLLLELDQVEDLPAEGEHLGDVLPLRRADDLDAAGDVTQAGRDLAGVSDTSTVVVSDHHDRRPGEHLGGMAGHPGPLPRPHRARGGAVAASDHRLDVLLALDDPDRLVRRYRGEHVREPVEDETGALHVPDPSALAIRPALAEILR